MNSSLSQWILNSGSEVIRGKDSLFVLTPAGRQAIPSGEVSRVIARIDDLLARSVLMKDSPTTTAGLAAVTDSGHPVFLKRCNNKGMRFTLRYLFRPARVFRAARAADRLAALGIDTPRVLLAGERRSWRILRAGYLLTETAEDIHSVSQLFMQSSAPDALLDSFLPFAAKTLARLHANRVIHGDLKVVNWYHVGRWSPDSSYGIWDLDSVRLFSLPVPHSMIDRELSRLVSSILHVFSKNPLAPRGLSCDGLARRLTELYAVHANGYIPASPRVAALARERLARLPDFPKATEAVL